MENIASVWLLFYFYTSVQEIAHSFLQFLFSLSHTSYNRNLPVLNSLSEKYMSRENSLCCLKQMAIQFLLKREPKENFQWRNSHNPRRYPGSITIRVRHLDFPFIKFSLIGSCASLGNSGEKAYTSWIVKLFNNWKTAIIFPLAFSMLG